MLYLLFLIVICHLSSPAQAEVKIDIVSAIKQLMIPIDKDYNLDPITVSETFEGCVFKPFEFNISNQRTLANPQDEKYEEPSHFKTKCTLTHKDKYIVEKNLARDYRMDISMHGPSCCVNILEIEAYYPNDIKEIFKDTRLKWTSIRCQTEKHLDGYEEWFSVSAPKKKNIFIKLSRNAGARSQWENLTVFWKIPKNLPQLDNDWTDKCGG
ncbi:MAG: hypothetical protein FJX03_00015 [Alphaproteobacteria bacterium]|nr:hypothetical protein [Alphaproteobacteria bacterium]